MQYRDGMTMKWQNGRQLTSISKSGLAASYAYNGDGVRTGKTVNGVTTNFIVDGSTILSQTGKAGSSPYVIDYLYDESGKPYGLEYDGRTYYYEYDGQGNVIALVDHHACVEAYYTYDTWGKLISVTDGDIRDITDPNDVANLNIFRYRGYCYDTETGLYYLQSRYYDPATGRFVNADGTIGANSDIKSANLFVYCGNNPVNNVDPSGTMYGPYTDQDIIDFMNEGGDGSYSYVNLYDDLCKDPNWVSDIDCTGRSNVLYSESKYGEPNSTVNIPTNTGEKKLRHFGPDGRAEWDLHFGHKDHHPDLDVPHQQDWVWDGDNGYLSKDAHNPTPEALEKAREAGLLAKVHSTYDPHTKTYKDILGRTIGYGYGSSNYSPSGIGCAAVGGAFMYEGIMWVLCF